jgi:hypothetical protein
MAHILPSTANRRLDLRWSTRSFGCPDQTNIWRNTLIGQRPLSYTGTDHRGGDTGAHLRRDPDPDDRTGSRDDTGRDRNLDPDSPWFIFQLTVVSIAFYVGLVLALAYYNARLFAQVADSIVIEGVGLRFQARPIDLVLLYFTNLAMNLLSAGLSYYFSRMRIARFIIRHLAIEGQIPPVQSSDSPNPKDLLGEGAEILLAGSYF